MTDPHPPSQIFKPYHPLGDELYIYRAIFCVLHQKPILESADEFRMLRALGIDRRSAGILPASESLHCKQKLKYTSPCIKS
jgi:hypothetical protein